MIFIAKTEAKKLCLLLNFFINRNHVPAPGGQQIFKAGRRCKWQKSHAEQPPTEMSTNDKTCSQKFKRRNSQFSNGISDYCRARGNPFLLSFVSCPGEEYLGIVRELIAVVDC